MALKLMLNEQMTKQGLNYSDVSRLLGVHRNVISRWNTKEVVPSLTHVEGLCRALGVGLEEILAFDPPLVKIAEPDEPITLHIDQEDLALLQRLLTTLVVSDQTSTASALLTHKLAMLVNRLQSANEAAIAEFQAKLEARQAIESDKVTQDGQLDTRKVFAPERFENRRGDNHWKRREKLAKEQKEEGTE